MFNHSNERGGAVYIDSSSDGDVEATFTNATFSENSSHDAGAIYLFANGDTQSLLKLADTKFRFNHSEHRAGAVYIDASFGLDATLSISASEFEGNSAFNSGGAIYAGSIDGGDLELLVAGTTFDANNAYYGGAIEASTAGTQLLSLITNSTFSYNGALYSGGAFDLSSSSEFSPSVNVFENLTFYGNHVDGGGTIVGNGGAISAYDAPANGSDFLVVKNSIFWDNSATTAADGPEIYNELANEGGALITVKYSVADNGCPDSVTCSNVSRGDPLLGPLTSSFGSTPVMIPGIGGSAIDMGDDASCTQTDQRGVPRPQGAHCDIGAVEFRGDRIFTDGFEK